MAMLIPCDCGYVAYGETTAELLVDIKAHLRSSHPQEVDVHSDGDLLDLTGTLRAYLDCDLSVPKTAERLFVHPNTVRYRLTKLEELTGLDTASGTSRSWPRHSSSSTATGRRLLQPRAD
jgi:hypothetical protein